MRESTRYRIDALNRTSCLALIALLTAVLALTLWLLDGPARTFACVASAALAALIAWHMRTCSVTVSAVEIRAGAGLFRCRIALQSVEGFSRAREGLALRWKKNGIGMPGFALGWFAAKDGRTIFVAAGRVRNAVRLQVRGKFDLIVGVDAPERLISEIERRRATFAPGVPLRETDPPGKSPTP